MEKGIKKVKEAFRTVKSVLFADPWLLYKKEVHLTNQSFYFPGTNGKAALLIHGWTSTPYEVRRLGIYLNENGYTVSAPMLSGHGTVPKDLENISWVDWKRDVFAAFCELKKEHSRVYVAGTSIGASLAIMLAQERKDIAGLVLMATPYRIRFEEGAVLLAKTMGLFKKYNRKYYPPTFGASATITRLVSYQSYPIKSAIETFNLVKIARKNLSKIGQPCFMLQSSSDHIVSRNSLKNIHAKIGSSIKQKKYIKRAYHTFISDIKNEKVFEEILDFINKN